MLDDTDLLAREDPPSASLDRLAATMVLVAGEIPQEPGWKSVELAVYSLWTYRAYLSPGELSVRYDVRLRDPDGDTRQFDVAVFDEAGTLHSVLEVQDRSRPLHKGEFGGFVDKMRELSSPRLNVITRSGVTAPVQRRVDREAKSGSAEISTFEFDEPARDFGDLASIRLIIAKADRTGMEINLDFKTRRLVCTTPTSGDRPPVDIIFGVAANGQARIWATLMVTDAGNPYIVVVSQGEITEAMATVHLEFESESGKEPLSTIALITQLPM